MLRSIRNSSQVVTLVSRLMIRASGAARVSSSSASPQMYPGDTGRGMGPLARSASATYSRASLRQGSKISGALGWGRSWSTPRPVITSPHRDRVTSAILPLDHSHGPEPSHLAGQSGPVHDIHHSFHILVGRGCLLGQLAAGWAADDDPLALQLPADFR